jgi:hypothetical protein
MSRHDPQLITAAIEVVRLTHEQGISLEQAAQLVRQAADLLDPPPSVPVT